jgi:uncharacterized membrane protein YfcA
MIFGFVVLFGALRLLFVGNLQPGQTSVERQKDSLLQYILWGMAVGIVSGLTGIGGGVILIPAMVIAFGFGMYQAIGTSSVAIAFNSVGGILAYAINGLPAYSVGYIDLLQFALLAGGSVLAAKYGVDAAHRLPAEKLKYIFVVLMIFIGLKMIGVFGWIGF